MADFDTVSASRVFELIQKNPDTLLVDVRSPGEHRGLHARGAVNLPLDQLTHQEVPELIRSKPNVQVCVICQGGNRSKVACGLLAKAGLTQLINVEGGTDAWHQAGLPVEKGEGAISIERQVRIVAGLMVFIGVLLGVFLHPGWLVLPGFVGAGLAFAGITDFCGMGLLLARMPWNR
ncbi:MAG: rhodanese-like domain-containing protein [Candidatus Methylacidiphilales bacterium]